MKNNIHMDEKKASDDSIKLGHCYRHCFCRAQVCLRHLENTKRYGRLLCVSMCILTAELLITFTDHCPGF